MQRLADVVETVRRGIHGQQLLQLDVHSQQIAHGVLVLDAVEPAESDLAPARLRGFHRFVDPLDQGLDFVRRRARLSLGRHLAGLEALAHGQPALPAGRWDRRLAGRCEVRQQAIEAKVSLRLRRSVTFETIASDKGTYLLLVNPRIWRRSRAARASGIDGEDQNCCKKMGKALHGCAGFHEGGQARPRSCGGRWTMANAQHHYGPMPGPMPEYLSDFLGRRTATSDTSLS